MNSSDGALEGEPMVGEFKDGRGQFYSHDIYKGRPVFVRITWSDFTQTTHQLEQAFSEDGGKSWETNLRVKLTRAPDDLRAISSVPKAGLGREHNFGWRVW